eukprot:CAMPEP_0197929024 /NCGR_PEP_ID=MMETSP1439-20131203/103235_1 /TAXON_ID=66791 /ORGANISM="Gonyaulax spinifera, Strain CCMP409" /LENGTH=324 /DNA_ID=CAMNT_0043551649 /DNA_START=123 /DNA_END=1096 /DNA_ORIENTATION=-
MLDLRCLLELLWVRVDKQLVALVVEAHPPEIWTIAKYPSVVEPVAHALYLLDPGTRLQPEHQLPRLRVLPHSHNDASRGATADDNPQLPIPGHVVGRRVGLRNGHNSAVPGCASQVKANPDGCLPSPALAARAATAGAGAAAIFVAEPGAAEAAEAAALDDATAPAVLEVAGEAAAAAALAACAEDPSVQPAAGSSAGPPDRRSRGRRLDGLQRAHPRGREAEPGEEGPLHGEADGHAGLLLLLCVPARLRPGLAQLLLEGLLDVCRDEEALQFQGLLLGEHRWLLRLRRGTGAHTWSSRPRERHGPHPRFDGQPATAPWKQLR